MNTLKKFCFSVTFAMGMLGFIGSANAVLITYSDLSSWQSGEGLPTATEDFNSILVDTSFETTTVSANNMTFGPSPAPFNPNVVNIIDAIPNFFCCPGSINGTAQAWMETANPFIVNISFTNGVTAWGGVFSQWDQTTSQVTLSFFDDTNALLDQTSLGIVANNQPQFFGVGLSTGTASRLEFASLGQAIFALDDIVMISPTSSVPEPTTLLLMGLGFAGLGFARRRLNA